MGVEAVPAATAGLAVPRRCSGRRANPAAPVTCRKSLRVRRCAMRRLYRGQYSRVLVTDSEYRKGEVSFVSAPSLECLCAPEAEEDLASAVREAHASHVIVGPRTYSGVLYDALPSGAAARQRRGRPQDRSCSGPCSPVRSLRSLSSAPSWTWVAASRVCCTCPAWAGRVTNPHEIVAPGDQITVRVLRVDEGTRRSLWG